MSAQYSRLPAGETAARFAETSSSRPSDAAAAEAAGDDGIGHDETGDSSYPPRKFTVAALSLGLRRHKTSIRNIIIALILTPLIVHFLCAYGPLAHSKTLIPHPLRSAKSVLLVVAHPDDECLFFSPSVTTLLQRGENAEPAIGHILVMSSGNHYGLGSQRRLELMGSCKELGVTQDNCDVLNNDDIQDDPVFWWPEQRLAQLIEPYMQKWDIDLVVTFDNGGVSGHINHCAVSAALKYMSETRPSFPPVYMNKSIFVLRKHVQGIRAAADVDRYAGIFDLPFIWLTFLPRLLYSEPSDSRALLVGSWRQYFQARRAFLSHQSQVVWDRWLYMVLYLNELRKVV